MRQSILAILCLAHYSNPLEAESLAPMESNLLFEETIKSAIKNDPWLEGSIHREKSLNSLSVAAGQLPDPKVSVGLANLATDTFDFDQERMTHLKLGFSQAFPRGKTRKLKQAQLDLQSQKYPYLRADRIGQITLHVGSQWLDLFETQESIRIIKDSQRLFENLVDVAESSYSSAIAKTNQLDIVQAELELSLLNDRLTVLEQGHQMQLAQLSRWLNRDLGENSVVDKQLPNIDLTEKEDIGLRQFMRHPAILSVDKNIESEAVAIKLAEQQFKPAWSLNAGYGYRSNDPSGLDRSDLLSVGVSFDLPIFTAKRQDKNLDAAVQSHSALLTDREDVIRKLMAINAENSEAIVGLRKRAKLYQEELLPQTRESVEIALRAYSSDEGTFNDVIRAQIAELDASLQLLKINVEIQKRILSVKYTRISETNHIISRGGDS